MERLNTGELLGEIKGKKPEASYKYVSESNLLVTLSSQNDCYMSVMHIMAATFCYLAPGMEIRHRIQWKGRLGTNRGQRRRMHVCLYWKTVQPMHCLYPVKVFMGCALCFFLFFLHEQVLALAVTETCLCSRRRHCTGSLITC